MTENLTQFLPILFMLVLVVLVIFIVFTWQGILIVLNGSRKNWTKY